MEIKVDHVIRLAPETMDWLKALVSNAGANQAPAADKPKKEKAAPAAAPVQVTQADIAASNGVKPAPKFTLEDVRKAATAKSEAGLRTEVKALIIAHGAAKTSEIDPSKFEAFMADLEKIKKAETVAPAANDDL
jgi:hypothetical protein